MASAVRPQTVLIVGAGIAGPALALLLQQKGYLPTVVEKVRDMSDVGIALSLHPNGMKVLHRAGVAADIANGPPSTLETLRWDEFTHTGKFLGGPGSALTSGFAAKYGWPILGVTRTRLQTLVVEKCRERGIPVHTGWKLAEIQGLLEGSGIVAKSEDGREIRADFIVGADGLKSRTREILLTKRGVKVEEPDFTHVVVQGGATPTPAALRDTPAIRIFYGGAIAVISHPLEGGMSVWGVNYREEAPVKESWRTVPPEELEREIEATLKRLEGWTEPVREMVANTKKIMAIGLYDREELPVEQWYCGRGVLIGDAAHPTTPHVGQGANQGLVDAWTLSDLLPVCSETSTESLTITELETIFHRLASTRQGPTTEAVRRARQQGELRVPADTSQAAREKRDNTIRSMWQNVDGLNHMYDEMYKGPFEETEGYAHVYRAK